MPAARPARGKSAGEFERCFITRMHQRAAESDLLIVNHHLFFADLALRQNDYAALLPDYAALVFDEAHEMEDVATQYFGVEVSSYRVEELARDTEATLRHEGHQEAMRFFAAVGELRRRADLFFELFPRTEGRSNFDNRDSFLEVNRGAYSALDQRPHAAADGTQPRARPPGRDQQPDAARPGTARHV